MAICYFVSFCRNISFPRILVTKTHSWWSAGSFWTWRARSLLKSLYGAPSTRCCAIFSSHSTGVPTSRTLSIIQIFFYLTYLSISTVITLGEAAHLHNFLNLRFGYRVKFVSTHMALILIFGNDYDKVLLILTKIKYWKIEMRSKQS